MISKCMKREVVAVAPTDTVAHAATAIFALFFHRLGG